MEERQLLMPEINESNIGFLKLTKIKGSNITLILNNSLEVEPYFDEQSQEVVFEIPEYNIIAVGVTREEAIQELQNDLVWLWEEYVETQEKNFSKDAKDLRNSLKRLIKGVEYNCEKHNREKTWKTH
ncbi:MAG: hypothetical protein LRZ99_04975 [Desulfotomaculum sp.]|nr:hypothetical protein [Desulfotomaculum sp.]